MKILVTGASGILGSAICKSFSSNEDNVQFFNRALFLQSKNIEYINFLLGFDCIVHAAANTNVEECEINPQLCYRDNTLLTENLAVSAEQAGCKFVYISSTGIYGSSKETDPYTEYDEVTPTTHHHKSKWLGEKAVKSNCSNPLILRAGWIFGGAPDRPKNFVAKRIEEALNAKFKKIQSNSQQRGVPTFANDFALMLREMLKKDEVGTFNVVNQGFASRMEYVSKILEIAEIDVDVLPAPSNSFERKANVSLNETAVGLKLFQLNYAQLPHWEISLKNYIHTDLKQWLTHVKNNG